VADLVPRADVRRFALMAPPELVGIILEFDWDRTKLHALELSSETVAIDELRWQLDLRWWKYDGHHFAVTPNDVRADRVQYAEHWQRMLTADLAFPIHLAETAPDRWTILDGVHRLLKADVLRHTQVDVMRVSHDQLATIAL
jgi:hypothetical protein